MFTVVYLCTQCPYRERWEEDRWPMTGVPREYSDVNVAIRQAWKIALARGTMCRVVDEWDVVVGQTADYRRVR